MVALSGGRTAVAGLIAHRLDQQNSMTKLADKAITRVDYDALAKMYIDQDQEGGNQCAGCLKASIRPAT